MAFHTNFISRLNLFFSSRASQRSSLPECCWLYGAFRFAAFHSFYLRTLSSNSLSERSQRASQPSSPLGINMLSGMVFFGFRSPYYASNNYGMSFCCFPSSALRFLFPRLAATRYSRMPCFRSISVSNVFRDEAKISLYLGALFTYS